MRKQSSDELTSAELGALERLLQQIERSTSHYEALSVGRSASDAQIATAYEQAAGVLLPVRDTLEARGDVVTQAIERVELATSRIAQAYSVLSNPNKRIEYDRFVIVKKTGPLTPVASLPAAPATESDDKQSANRSSSSASPPDLSAGLDANATPDQSDDAEENRRRCQRFPLNVSTTIVGYDRKTGKWEECAETVDASRTGITLHMGRRVRHGSVLHLTLPLPARLRNHATDEPDYQVYALVRRVQPVKKGVRVTAVEFIGEHPPVGYLDKPWATFQTKPWAGAERRRKPREERGEMVWVEYFTENLQCLRQEAGRTEDVSEGGLRLIVKAAPPEFEFVRVSYPERGIESYALVCNRFIKRDGLERLCLQLIDNDELAGRAVMQPEIAALASAAATDENQNAPGRGKRILVADDDLPLRRVLGKILTSAGYEVVLVEDGKAAVEKAAEMKPDLVITDGLMPKMHGFLVCKALKEMQPAPKVIMLTAVYTKLNYRFEARDRYGADELLTKPFEVANLLKCIERHLGLVPQALAG
ncbi:MAG: two-component system, NtrC family, response regulator AtoC [Blastocatellia bacterium]